MKKRKAVNETARSSPEMPRSLVGRTIRRVSRYSEILGVLFRYGFPDLVHKLDSDAHRRLRKEHRPSRKARRSWSRAERMRRALEELGPAFVKLGQLLSHRPDLLPAEWLEEFEKLRSTVPPVDEEAVIEVIREELGRHPDELFEHFDRTPLASASIAQVHRAVLKIREEHPEDRQKAENREVVIKIQRPGIRRIIESDFVILHDLARIAERRVPALAVFRPVDSVRELEQSLLMELDFRNELDNLNVFMRNFADNPQVTSPKPFAAYSGTRVLTMSYMEGIHVGDSELLDASGADRKQIARIGAESVLHQIFDHRFFHSDPHSGNILILPGNVIAFLDFGQVGTILPSQRAFLTEMLSAIIRTDAVQAVRALLGWSGYRDPDVVRHLITDTEIIIERYLSRSFGQLDLGEMVSALINMVRRYEIEIPVNFFLLAKSLATIENIACTLDPDFDFMQASRPFAKRMIRRELSPGRIAGQLAGTSWDALRFIRDFPGEARELMSLLKAGRLRMEFELKGLDPLNETLRRSVTRLASAVLLAAMIMGSSLLVQSRIPPLVFGIPAIGILGFLFSGIAAVFLLIDFWRRR